MAGVGGFSQRLLNVSAFAALLTLVGIVNLGVPGTSGQTRGASRHIRITARDFAFAPATIEVDPGDRVTIELEAGDVVHGLHLDGYDVELTADPGRPASATFVADRLGSFRFRCSIPCGPLHPFMSGVLRVGPPTTFWQALVLAVAAVAVGGLLLSRAPAAARERAAPS
jgi:heme/copper-type cytochrome/quinol oxidase subunit 2